MADNYLEKRMEEHRLTGSSKTRAGRVLHPGQKPGYAIMKVETRRVLVYGDFNDVAKSIVRKFRNAGCQVAFICDDDKEGMAFAQRTGSRFYPGRIAGEILTDIMTAWGGLDGMILTSCHLPIRLGQIDLKRVIAVYPDASIPEFTGNSQYTSNAISTTNISPESAADFCLYLCLSTSAFIDRKVFVF